MYFRVQSCHKTRLEIVTTNNFYFHFADLGATVQKIQNSINHAVYLFEIKKRILVKNKYVYVVNSRVI